MKTIIAGSRTLTDAGLVAMTIAAYVDWDISEVVNGGAKGADKLGKEWAEKKGLPVKTIDADWNTHGRAAGPIRNRKMADYADALVAFWDGESPGTRNMIEEAQKRGLKIHIQRI